MNESKIHSHKNHNPILVGFFTFLLTIVFGMSIAIATGTITPEHAFAQLAPPCCTIVPPPPPPPLPPPPPPPPPIPPPIVVDSPSQPPAAAPEPPSVPPTPPPSPAAPSCTLAANPSAITSGASSALTWTTTNADTFSIDQGVGAATPAVSGTTSVSPASTITYTGTAVGAAGSSTCAATVAVSPGGGGGGGSSGGPVGGSGGGSGGGGAPPPNIVLAVLPHVGLQPLVYLYLSQIPYTGLDLGPVGTVVYWTALVVLALVLAYLTLFIIVPLANRYIRNFGARVADILNAPAAVLVSVSAGHAPHAEHPAESVESPAEVARGYSTYDGFKSFAHNGALSIEDIVKSLSRSHPAPAGERNVEPIFENIEPIRENIEPIATAEIADTPAPPSRAQGFVTALVAGDRIAVFTSLRQHIQDSGAPEQLIASAACLLDDVYRSRIDGTVCDENLARLTARLSSSTLERVVTALATAIDSSYSTGVTGAKLALTRVFLILGA